MRERERAQEEGGFWYFLSLIYVEISALLVEFQETKDFSTSGMLLNLIQSKRLKDYKSNEIRSWRKI